MRKILTILTVLMVVATMSFAATVKLDQAKHKKLNTFFSNFSEANVGSFAQGTLADQVMLDFALRHLYINNFNSLKISKDGNSVTATTKQVDTATLKYFGQKINQHKKSSYTMPCADGEAFYFSQLDTFEPLENKTFKTTGTIYSTGSGGTPDVHGTPADWKKADEEVSVVDKFSAIIKPEGKTYVLVEYTLTGAPGAVDSESTTAKISSENPWAKALTATKKVTKLSLRSAEDDSEPAEDAGMIISFPMASKHLPAGLGSLTHLQELQICGLEGLEDLPAELGDLQELKSLIIDNGNGCSMNISLPESIGNLTNLKVLQLYGALDARSFADKDSELAKAKKLPQALEKLQNLEELDLGRNGLTEVPPQIAALAKLSSLCLNFNEIKELPEFVGNLVNLKNLEIHANGGTKLPDSLKNLKGLKIGMGNALLKLNEQEALQKRFPDATFDFTNEFDDDSANEESEPSEG